jgi:tetratricopeptide (TPR) repeat protein
MANVVINRNQLDVAEGHCQRCLTYSRKFGVEGGFKITTEFTALCAYAHLRNVQFDYSGAVTFAEEAYNLVVVAYDPVHPEVQEAAGKLIHYLINSGDLFNAERYAQQTYENLKNQENGMDQECEEIATGAFNLANVIYRQDGDLIRAEKLARDALRIRNQSPNCENVGISCALLAEILQQQNKFGDETKKLYERSLALFTRYEGTDAINTANGNDRIGQFHYDLAKIQITIGERRKHLLLAKSYFKEVVRIEIKVRGPTHPKTAIALSSLSYVSIDLDDCV